MTSETKGVGSCCVCRDRAANVPLTWTCTCGCHIPAPASGRITDYDRFKADHPELLKMAEEHLEEMDRKDAEIAALKERIDAADRLRLHDVDRALEQTQKAEAERDRLARLVIRCEDEGWTDRDAELKPCVIELINAARAALAEAGGEGEK